MTGPRAPAVAFILATVLMDVLAFGIVAPVLPTLIEDFLAGDTARAAEAYGVFATAWAAMQFLFSPLLGMLSDRFGRRKVLLISLTGLGLDYVLMALAPSLAWLFVGRVISGITAATYSTAAAYIADVTPPEQRAARFGLIGATWGVGFVVGPAVGGLLGEVDPRLPFWVAAGLALANALYGYFVLPESLPPERRARRFEWSKANPVGALALVRATPGLGGLVAMHTLYMVGHYALPAVFVLYAGYRYGWSSREVGLTLGFVGLCTALVQGGLVGPAVRALGERRAVLAGLAAGAAAFAVYGFAPGGAWLLAGIPVGALQGLYGAAAMSLMSQRVGPQQQGRLQGLNGSLLGITGLVGPALFTATFAAGIRPGDGPHVPGLPFFVATAVTFAALAIAVRVARPARAAGAAVDPRPAAD